MRVTSPKARRENSSRHWILVTDHNSVHIYEKTSTGVERVPELHIPCSHPMPDGSCPPEVFRQDLARWLAVAAEEKTFGQVALLAPAETLAALWPLLNRDVRDRLCIALTKDIAAIAEDEIEDRISNVVWL